MNNENLSREKAKEKFESIVTDVKICMMITNLSGRPLSAVPMSTKKVDKDGIVWFLTGTDSDHIRDLEMDSQCQLLYSDARNNFLSVYGKAEIDQDRSKVEELYSRVDNAYFDGKEDPKIVSIKFIPEQAAYWNSDESRIITLFKLGLAAITGENQNLRNSGKIDL